MGVLEVKRINKIFFAFGIIVLMICATVAAAVAAEPFYTVKSGETISSDVFIADQSVINEGTVKGDLIAGASDVNSKGVIEGDLLCAASEIFMSGKIFGNMRAGGNNITISGQVGKNVNSFSRSTKIMDNALIGGNILVLSQDVNISGKINGKSIIFGQNIVLNGEFLGDVEVNMGPQDEEISGNVTFTVMPGTKIHGRLSYKGVAEAAISKDAQIKEINFIKAKEAIASGTEASVNYAMDFIKMILTMVLYFLIGLLLYKFFPYTFKKQCEAIDEKPWPIAARGIIALFFPVAFLLSMILLFIMSIWIISPSIVFMLGAAVSTFYILLFYLSTIPVSLWLGNKIFKDKNTLTVRFGVGLLIITIGLYSLRLASNIPGVGGIFGVVASIITLVIAVFGAGSLLYGVSNIFSSIRAGEKRQVSISTDVIN